MDDQSERQKWQSPGTAKTGPLIKDNMRQHFVGSCRHDEFTSEIESWLETLTKSLDALTT